MITEFLYLVFKKQFPIIDEFLPSKKKGLLMPERPNILLIITDHWRGDCLGRLNHPMAETPHLDSLSAEGVTFTRAYTPSPSCIPARRCLMSGQTPNGTGMLGYKDSILWDYPNSMAGCLARSGYQTINVGKTHFFPRRLHLGYEQLISNEDYIEWLEKETGIPSPKMAHGVHGNSWMARPNHLQETQMEETWFTSKAIDRVKKRDPTRPFFLTLSFNGPHPPWCPPQVYYDQFINREMPAPTVGAWAIKNDRDATKPLDVNAWRGRIDDHLNQRARAAYFAFLAYLDAQVGRMVEWLGRNGLKNNTMIAFTSDHGEMLGDHHLWRKTYAYEASARIPLLIRPAAGMELPTNVNRGHVCGWEDIMPTFLDAAGAPIPDSVEGKSLLPIMRDESSPWREYYHHEHAPCYAPDNCYECLTTEKWKYIWNPVTGDQQLFDLEQDPDECHDLAGQQVYAEELAGWRAKLAKHLHGRPEPWSDGSQLKTGPFPVWRGS